MRTTSSCVLIILSLLILRSQAVIDPLTATSIIGALTVSGLLNGGYLAIKCKFYECCTTEQGWLTQDFKGLAADLDEHLYGQHLVKNTVVRALEHHFRHDNPQKALVMSFHGPTGTGKTFVSSLIAKHLYKEGMNSAYVQLWIGKLHFGHEARLEEYAETLKKTLEEKISSCERSLFIIDEMDHIAPGVMDLLKPYLDFHEKINEVDYRKATYIFLSNSGSSNITSVAFRFKQNGRARQDIRMPDVGPLIENGAFNERGGLWHTSLISNSLVDLFVPFLPLEYEHVQQCIRSYLRQKGCPFTEYVVTSIADQLTYAPTDFKYFSKSGCKLIASTVALTYSHSCMKSNQ